MPVSSFKVLILGAGAGGISVAAKLNRHLPEHSIAVVDPADEHYYQPLWTLAGAGVVRKETSARPMKDLIPSGVAWIKEKVMSIDPEAKRVVLTGDTQLSYDFLVVATGLKLNWDKIEGLGDNLGKNGICSVYQYDQVDSTSRMIEEFQGGTAVFVMPPVPIKCAGAPQKIMYLFDDVLRRRGVRHQAKIQFATAGKAMFGIPVFAQALTKIVNERDIEPKFEHKIVGVDPARKEAFFDVTSADGQVTRQSIKYDLLHLVPTMSAHPFIAESNLAFKEGDQKGWLEVDKFTLQHLRYPNIFGVGDVTGVPNSKTGAAIRKQYPIVVKNLLSVMRGAQPMEKYDGYSSCPLITEIGKVMLAEFGYDSKLMPTFPLNPAVPRRSYWFLKTLLLPKLYWHGMLKGLA
jgi:sulfide:quinone oxidoreductase